MSRLDNARRLLMQQYEALKKNKDDGFRVWLDNANLFKWRVVIDGPPDSPYAGGKFVALIEFPKHYPLFPPEVKFTTQILHPNIDKNGLVCISILHPPGNDPYGYEKASERWNRTRTAESILVSVQLLMAEPNFDSPANMDAALLYRNDPARYREELRRLVDRVTEETNRVEEPEEEAPLIDLT